MIVASLNLWEGSDGHENRRISAGPGRADFLSGPTIPDVRPTRSASHCRLVSSVNVRVASSKTRISQVARHLQRR